MPVRVAVVGIAGIGRRHVDLFASSVAGAELAAVCDIVPDAATRVAGEAGVPGYTDFAALLADVKPDAVSLCTPPLSHGALTAQAAAAGVHVLAEKPMANSVEHAQGMIDACRAAGVVLMIGQKKRYLPVVQRLRELLAGELGPIQHLVHRYPHPWMSNKEWYWSEADGGGTQLENAIHAADLIRYLAGPVRRVYAEGAAHFAQARAPQINDACYTVRFESGAIGCVEAGMVSLPAMNFEDLFVACDGGVAEIHGGFDRADQLRWALRSAPNELHEESFTGDPFVLEMEHFVHCIATGTTPITSGEEGRDSVRLCLAVKQSARSGQPVDLD